MIHLSHSYVTDIGKLLINYLYDEQLDKNGILLMSKTFGFQIPLILKKNFNPQNDCSLLCNLADTFPKTGKCDSAKNINVKPLKKTYLLSGSFVFIMNKCIGDKLDSNCYFELKKMDDLRKYTILNPICIKNFSKGGD